LFEGGLKGASVASIAEATGISKGGFYLFFESKEELLVEIIERFERQLLAEIQTKLKKGKPLTDILMFTSAKWQTENLLAKLGPDDLLGLQRALKLERFRKLMDIDLRIAATLAAGLTARKQPVQVSETQLAALLRSIFTVFKYESEAGDEGAFARKTLVDLVASRIAG
jgi:AcrR family transcriptional regulator